MSTRSGTPAPDDGARDGAERSPARDQPRAYAAAAGGTADAAFVPPEPPPAPAVPSGHAMGRETEVVLPTTPRRAALALTALAVTAFLFVTNEIAPLGVIQRIAEDLGRTESEVGLLTTSFALVVMITTVPLTLLTTRLPRRSLLVVTIAFWAGGALLAGTADTFAQLLGGRAVTAMGHALFWAVATPAAAGMFHPSIRGKSVTRLLLGATGAGVIGLPLATWLAQQTDWRVPFVALGVAGVVMAIVVAVLMPSYRTEEGSIARGELPSMRRFWRILAVAVLTTGAMATTWTYISPFFVDVSGFAESTVPLLLFIGGFVGVVAMWLTGRYIDRWPVKTVALGQSILAVMWAGFALGGASPVVAVTMLVLQGFGWSILVAALVNWALRHTPWASDIGNGAYASAFNAGNVVGSLLGAGILAWWGAQWLPYASFTLTLIAAFLVWRARSLPLVLSERGRF